ncbi:SET methyltransferase domain containing protein [Nitzschia inconspicua]|uniref:SET methyltransferase domain containing protein n=1 Tax=Nitzschia inconspicua TaxID=303405 RepID=A0A9K3PG53_9STRA|nr:SET methyltransferase domain containing protein [Nitzschia inconspicua]
MMMCNGDRGIADDDDDDDDSEACLMELLGGITIHHEWREEDNNIVAKMTPGLVDPSTYMDLKKAKRKLGLPTVRDTIREQCDNNDEVLFQNAFVCSESFTSTSNHKVQRPPLQIVHFKDNDRGNGLVATRFLAKGQVIYTERAAVATQQLLLLLQPTKNGREDLKSSNLTAIQATVQACQQCFRSMEHWTKLVRQQQTTDGQEFAQPSTSIPYPELWPVLPLDFDIIQDVPNAAIRVDKYDRLQCTTCQSLFCSKSCHQQHVDQFGSCCLVRRLFHRLPLLLRDEHDNDDDDDEGVVTPPQSPVVLGSLLFLQLVRHYQTHGHSLQGHWIHRICGTASDLQKLELGKRVQKQDGQSQWQYTLQPLHDYIMNDLLHINGTQDMSILSLDLLESLVAKAARNGVSLLTQSPFKPYYAGLLRKTNYGGRQSEAHHRNMQQLVTVLGQESLYRGMDRDVDAMVAPEITGLFPLTSQCNHSCEPNAQLQSQEFVDSHVDVVALRDIAAGEEVCISYVGRRNNRFQRRKELRGSRNFNIKLLFAA